MIKRLFPILALVMLMSACSREAKPTVQVAVSTKAPLPATSTPFLSVTSTATMIPSTPTITPSPTLAYPAEGRGPTNFSADVNPLTGLQVKEPENLNRRPIVIKVENIPREHRPQWGLSLADMVYEYYTEFGSTRFAAIFYGQNAERVGPIRSGRFFDVNVVQMYKSLLVYGSAYTKVQERFFNSDFASRLLLETNESCPGVCRYDPNGQNLLVSNTTALMDYVKKRAVDNTRQNLDGMFFKLEAPTTGDAASQVYVRYSGAIYNRWDYDTATGKYLRFADKQNDINRDNEAYNQLTDRLTSQPIAADNVVMACMPHQYYVKRADAEVIEVFMDNTVPSYIGCDGQTYTGGTGPAYIARDGKINKVLWKREKKDSILTLVNTDGTPFAFKPGQTWIEVLGASSTVEQKDAGTWRFNFRMAP